MRNVGNFWLVLNVDGRATTISAGPRAKDGGFNLNIYVRARGVVYDRPIRILGRCTPTGVLVVSAEGSDGTPVMLSTSVR